MDKLNIAIMGLDTFMKNYCKDDAKTAEKDEPCFNCDGCIFGDGCICRIKAFAVEKTRKLPDGFGAMSR